MIRESENHVATRKKKKVKQDTERERERAMKKTDASEMATEFLLSQTRDMLDNALKKSIHEREVLLSTRKVICHFFCVFRFEITRTNKQKLRAFDLCVQSMVSTIREQRSRIQALERNTQEEDGKNKEEDGKNKDAESRACKASACAVARDAATYIQGRLRGLDEYIQEKEAEKINREYETSHISAVEAVLRARAVASTAGATAKRTILGLEDVLKLYQTLSLMKKTQKRDIDDKEEQIHALRTQLKEIGEENKKQKVAKITTEKDKKTSPSFLGHAGTYAIVALASGVITALIQKFIIKM